MVLNKYRARILVPLLTLLMSGIVNGVDPLPLSNADAVSNIITISLPGSYRVIEDLIYPVVINVSDVALNLNRHKVSHNDSADSIITVKWNVHDVSLFNGKIYNTDLMTTGTGSGVLVLDGTSKIYLNNLDIFHCGYGVLFAGIVGRESFASQLFDVDCISSATGIALHYANQITVRNCNVIKSEVAGFDLLGTQASCLYDCQALKTTGTATVVGFRSERGQCNMFQRCVAMKTTTSSTTYGDTANGFLLTGAEAKTKILDCIVGETDVLLTPTAITYGIHIEPTLLPFVDLLTPVGVLVGVDFGGAFLSWSPDAHFIVGCYSDILSIASFDGTTLALTTSLSLIAATITAGVACSPDGKYVAVIDLSGYLYVFSFDGATLEQKAVVVVGEFGLSSLAWSPNGKYIVIGDKDVDPAYLRVYSFDGLTLTPISTLAVPGGGSLVSFDAFSWSPDGKYLAAIYSNVSGQAKAVIYEFDGSNLTDLGNVIDSSNPDIFHDIAWSPDGKYIALVKSNYISVYNLTTLVYPPAVTVATSDFLGNVCWAPDGNYLATVGASSETDGYLRVWEFNGNAMTLTELKSILTGSPRGLAWSPDGTVLAVGQNGWTLIMYSAMYGPTNCLIDNCRVCDTQASNVAMGRGIVGAGSNIFTNNIASNNGVNYCYGIPNVYYGTFDLPRLVMQPFENRALPSA